MADSAIVAEFREDKGKGFARRLRAAGRIPAVLYGQGKEPVSLSVDATALHKMLKAGHAGINTLIDLSIENRPDLGKPVVLVKDLQRDPVRGSMVHADLYAVDLQARINVSVPVHLTGTAHGVTMGGGVLDHSLREIEIECLPRAIPDEIILDVSALDVGQSVHVRELTLPEGVVLLTDGDLGVVSIVAPAEEAAPEVAAEEGVAAEPAEGDAAAAEGAGDAKKEGKSEG